MSATIEQMFPQVNTIGKLFTTIRTVILTRSGMFSRKMPIHALKIVGLHLTYCALENVPVNWMGQMNLFHVRLAGLGWITVQYDFIIWNHKEQTWCSYSFISEHKVAKIETNWLIEHLTSVNFKCILLKKSFQNMRGIWKESNPSFLQLKMVKYISCKGKCMKNSLSEE